MAAKGTFVRDFDDEIEIPFIYEGQAIFVGAKTF